MTFDEQLDVYLSVTEMLQHGVMWLDGNGNILGVNSRFAKELGYDRSAFRRKSIFQVNPNTTFLEWKKLWGQLLTERQITLETEQLTSSGTLFPIRLRGLLLSIGDEEVCLAVVENLLEGDRYRDLLRLTEKISRTGSWEWDLLHEEIIVTDGMCELMGMPRQNNFKLAAGREVLAEKLYPDDLAELRGQLENSVKTGKPFEMDITLRRGAGEEVRLSLSAKPVQNEGQTHKVCGILRDLSPVADRTDELYLTQFCVDNASQMVYWLGSEGNFIYANKAFCRRLGYELDELLQLNLLDVEPGLKKQGWQKRWKELKKKKRLELLTTRRTRSGEDLPVRLTLNHVSYGGKEYELAFVLDQKQAVANEDLLELSFRSLEQAREMVYWLNPDGTFFYFNETFCEKIGYARKELEGKSLMEVIPGLGKSEFKKIWEQLRKQLSAETERTIVHRDGREIPVEATITLVEVNGKEYSCTTMRDITLRKKREAERELRLEEIESLKNQLEKENIQLREDIEVERGMGNIISRSPRYKPVLRQIGQVADTNATVLILGETGTGKELVAKAIHRLSERGARPMVKVNCGALPANLIESELFGHEKGAFTGAFQRKTGRFESADGSTLFLDEIGELPLDLQAKLLRVLQEGEFERVGGNEVIKVDVRIIAATNRNLEERTQKGEFREDLFYRLNVFPIYNIPLRERPDDIPILVKHFVEKYNRRLGKKVEEVPQAVMKNMMKYEFPGNVRELENLIERAVILSPGKRLTIDFDFRRNKKGRPKNFPTMEQLQREHILRALKRTNGKITGAKGAAELLGMKDKTLYSRMTKLGIGKMDFLN